MNGAPHAVRYRDEAFFVDAALGGQGSPVRESLRERGGLGHGEQARLRKVVPQEHRYVGG